KRRRATEGREIPPGSGAIPRSARAGPGERGLALHLLAGFRGLGDYEGQKRELESAIQIDSNLAPAYYSLAQLYVKQGSVAQAKQALKTALAISPQFAEAQQALSSLDGDRERSE